MADDRINLLDPDNNYVSLPASQLEAAQSQGYKIPTAEQEAHHQRVLELSDPNQSTYQQVLGKTAAFTGSAANTMSLGSFDPLLKKFAPETHELLSATREANPNTSTAGSAAGFLASLPVGGEVLNPVGEAAGKAILPGATNLLGEVGGKAAAQAVNFGTQGVAADLPYAAAQTIAGNPEEAAESLVISGLGGVALGAGSSLIGDVLGAVKEPAVGVLKKGEDYITGALENLEVSQNLKQAGYTKASIKGLKGGFDRAKELSDFIKEKDIFGMLSNAPDEYAAVSDLNKAAGQRIGVVTKTIDASGKRFIDPVQLLQDIKKNIPRPSGELLASEGSAYDKAMSEVLGTMFPKRTIAKYGDVNSLLAAIDNGEVTPNFPRFQSIYAAKDKLGDYAYNDRGFPRPGRTVVAQLERTLNDSIDNGLEFAERSFPAKRAEWLDAKRDYRNYKALLEPLKNKIATEMGNQLVRPSDFAAGIIGSAAGGGPGAVKGYLFNVMRHEFGAQITSRLLDGVNSAIEKRNNLISKGVDAFYAGVDKIPAPIKEAPAQAFPASMGALSRYVTELLNHDEPDKQQAVEKLSQALTEATSNAAVTTNAVTSATDGLDKVHPDLSAVVNQRITTALQYLSTQIPQSDSPQTPFRAAPYKFSDADISSFERKLTAALNPGSLLQDLQQGTLHEDSVAAVKDLYPLFFNKLSSELISKAVSKNRTFSFAQRSQLALILGDTMDPVLSPDFIQTLQGNYNRTPDANQQGGSNNNSSFKPDISGFDEHVQTEIERVSAR